RIGAIDSPGQRRVISELYRRFVRAHPVLRMLKPPYETEATVLELGSWQLRDVQHREIDVQRGPWIRMMYLQRNAANDRIGHRLFLENLRDEQQRWTFRMLHVTSQAVPPTVKKEADLEPTSRHASMIARRPLTPTAGAARTRARATGCAQ